MVEGTTVLRFGRVRLTPTRRKIWLTLAGAMPGDVRTVDHLLLWVRQRKAEIQGEEHEAAWPSRMACLDALFEWTTGVEMPDAPVPVLRSGDAPRSHGRWRVLTGERAQLERKLLYLLLTGRADESRTRAIADRLLARAPLSAVGDG